MAHTRIERQDWHVAFVLPNLELPPFEQSGGSKSASNLAEHGLTLGTDDVAIVPTSDPRVQEITREVPNIAGFLGGFRTYLGERIKPAVLIYRDTRALPTHAGEALTAFRNVIALSTVLYGKALYLKDARADVSWADTFDFYPVSPDADGRLHIRTAALTSVGTMGSGAHFVGVAGPHVPREGTLLRYDQFLHRALGAEWRRKYVLPARGGLFGRSLFRSLEVAMHAAAVPIRNNGSAHDFGLSIANWVSAIEQLTRHSHGNSGEREALDLLSGAHWQEAKLARPRYTIRLGRKAKDEQRINAIQYACHVLYRARNDFLHGNPIRLGRLRMTRREEGAVLLPAVAAVVYRAALAAYLMPRHAPKLRGPRGMAEAVWEGINAREYDYAMLEVLKLNADSPARRANQAARRRRRAQR